MKRIEIDDFAKFKFISALTLSPDGKTACFAVTAADKDKNAYNSNLYIRRADGRVSQLTSGGRERSFFWLDNETVVFAGNRDDGKEPSIQSKFYKISINGGEATLAYTLPVPTDSLVKLPDGNFLAVCTVFPGYEDLYKGDVKLAKKYLDEQKENADYEVITQNPWWWNGGTFTKGAYSALYRYDVKSGRLTQLTEKNVNISNVDISEDGKTAFFIALDFASAVPDYHFGSKLFRLDVESGTITPVAVSSEKFNIGGYIIGRTKLFIFASDNRRGINTDPFVYSMKLSGGKLKTEIKLDMSLGSSVGSDIRYGGGEYIKPDGDTLYFISTVYDSAKLFKLEDGKVECVLDRDGSVDAFDLKSGNLLAVAMFDMKGQEIYDIKGKRLTDFNTRAVAGKYVAQPEILNFTNGDYEVHGFVLKPFGFEKGKKYPVIIDVHGGPKTVYGPVFYHEMQYWASEGYFVIFCNPTGSDGRGEFMDIRGAYGDVDYNDLMKFCDSALEAYPEMDAENFFETGGSYGGFMTNWIIGHTDRFRACASQRSISNWFSFSGISDIGVMFAKDQTAGDIWDNPELMWKQSPLKYAGNVKTPTLFIHSFEDYRCPIDQGYQMYTALVHHGVESKMVLFRGENHELSRSGKPQHRVRRLKEITEWFKGHKA